MNMHLKKTFKAHYTLEHGVFCKCNDPLSKLKEKMFGLLEPKIPNEIRLVLEIGRKMLGKMGYRMDFKSFSITDIKL